MYPKFAKQLFIGFIIFFSLSIIQAQIGTLWKKTYGGIYYDNSYSVQQTMDEGYIMTGTRYSFGSSSNDVWLIKTNADGDTLWTKTFGESGSDYGYSVQQTEDEGYIVTGFKDAFDGNGSVVWLIKTNRDGDTLWTKTFWGYYVINYGQSVQQTEDEGYIIVGYTESWDYSNSDILLIKTNTSGDTLWTKTFGGSEKEYGCSIRQTLDEGYIITGSTSSFGAGGSDVWLIKTNVSGDTLWTKTFGGSKNEFGNSIQQTKDEGYIITGSTSSFGAGGSDVWLIKTNVSGDTLWTKTFGGSKGDDEGNSVQQTLDGGYIITGSTSSFDVGRYYYSDVWLIKTNGSGDTLWTKTFGGSNNECGNSIQQTKDEGYIITGYTSSFGAGGGDVWLIKTTPYVDLVKKDNINILFDYNLSQNYPNPFNPNTTIEFDIPTSGFVSLKVFNVTGQEVGTLISNKLNQGSHTYKFDGSGLACGIYYYQLVAGEFHQVKKMILLK
jgi:hypothetical protein